MSAAVIAASPNIGLIFSWVILLPGFAMGLIVVAVVTARGEKAEDEKLAGRWGPRAQRSDD
ncbi:MAG: hypothetical protein M3401_09970 [Actinomycetota bacterium]|nr:hypothetical protein [Actinomycetota bacterium]